MTTTTLTITTSAEVTPEQLFEFIKAHCERGPEPCMLPEDVFEKLDASEIWVEEVETPQPERKNRCGDCGQPAGNEGQLPTPCVQCQGASDHPNWTRRTCGNCSHVNEDSFICHQGIENEGGRVDCRYWDPRTEASA